MKYLIILLLFVGVSLSQVNNSTPVLGNKATLRQDNNTWALVEIDFEHHKLHEDSHFTYSQYDMDFDIADTIEILIVTPNTTKWVHMIFDVEAALNTVIGVYENTVGAGHTASSTLVDYNNNRNSTDTSMVILGISNDDAADGTNIFPTGFGIASGTGVNKIAGGGESRGAQEWVLKQNSKYLLRVHSLTDNSSVAIKLVWYEHVSL